MLKTPRFALRSQIDSQSNKIILFLKDIKIEHSVFALPFAYVGLFLAERRFPSAFLVLWITVAMVSFRTMAMAVNRLFDRKIDAENPRTQERALPQKKLAPGFVWIAGGLSLAVFEWSAWRLGVLCFWLSPIPVVLAWLYPFAKRFTWLSHFVLGLVLGIAPYGAWVASRGTLDWAPAFLTAGVTLWVAGFDMIYALQDIDFDVKRGLYSFPARFGIAVTLKVTRGLHILAVFFWAMAGLGTGLGICYWVGLAVVAGFLIREHQMVRAFGVVKINEAFFMMNAIVSLTLFLAVVFDVTFR